MDNTTAQPTEKKWLKPSDALNRVLHRRGERDRETDQEVAIRRLGFYVGNIGLLIAENITSELNEMRAICPIPNTARWLLGLINLRGNLVPVFDLFMLLNIEKAPKKKQMLLILGAGETAGALLIDNLPIHLSFLPSDKLESLPPLPDVIKPYATIGFEKNGEIWFNFDHNGFFESLARKVAV